MVLESIETRHRDIRFAAYRTGLKLRDLQVRYGPYVNFLFIAIHFYTGYCSFLSSRFLMPIPRTASRLMRGEGAGIPRRVYRLTYFCLSFCPARSRPNLDHEQTIMSCTISCHSFVVHWSIPSVPICTQHLTCTTLCCAVHPLTYMVIPPPWPYPLLARSHLPPYPMPPPPSPLCHVHTVPSFLLLDHFLPFTGAVDRGLECLPQH
jgi:hypothetical protein